MMLPFPSNFQLSSMCNDIDTFRGSILALEGGTDLASNLVFNYIHNCLLSYIRTEIFVRGVSTNINYIHTQ